VIARNSHFTIVKQITSNSFTDDVTLLKYSDLVPYFMFAPVTSCDVERSFSKFKDILTFKRSSFTAENLEKYIVIQTYYSNTVLNSGKCEIGTSFTFTSHKNYRIISFSHFRLYSNRSLVFVCKNNKGRFIRRFLLNSEIKMCYP
jgi:hypothetical protein